jgi:glycosyltransferase involved in cell wall biosynthesis
MLDSIHVGRWLSQFEDTEAEFVIFPSKKFRSINPLIFNLLEDNSKVRVKIYQNWIPKNFFGYFDYITKVVPGRFNLDLRKRALRRLISLNEFNFIHALEIQGAGYLVDEATPGSQKNGAKFILTNWGSDIYYFQNSPEQKRKITSALKKADYYSAECDRDYLLARQLGFVGHELPCIPNAGGFTINRQPGVPASKRRQVIVKCYGGQFGRGGLIVEALRQILPIFTDYRVFLYSVTVDLVSSVLELSQEFPGRISFVTQKKPISRQMLLSEFSKSRVYIGASLSDGISTSFLEALASGAFPIQTNTSCANEWINRGAVGMTTELDIAEFIQALTKSLADDELVDYAQLANSKIVATQLSDERIRLVSHRFYSEV